MKRSEFRKSIRNEIIDILEATQDDVENQKAYNDELEKTKQLSQDLGLSERNDRDYRDDGYVDKKDVDDTTNLYVHNDPESMAFENNNPVVAKGDGIEITQDEMNQLHKTGKVKLSDGSILVFPKKPLKEEDEDDDMDKKAMAAAKKGDSISKVASKLQQTTKEMKQVVKKWKTSEGAEKEKLTNRLRELTKIKKELEGLL
tara:strand:- start:75 stop:677 length:603 start_codon:yes stop_codon:yes gene_type:complete